MPMIFSEHMEQYDLEVVFPRNANAVASYQRTEVEYVHDPPSFHSLCEISHTISI